MYLSSSKIVWVLRRFNSTAIQWGKEALSLSAISVGGPFSSYNPEAFEVVLHFTDAINE